MNLSKKLGRAQKQELDETKAIVVELLRCIHELGIVIEEIEAGEASKEEIQAVKQGIKDLLNNFGVKKVSKSEKD